MSPFKSSAGRTLGKLVEGFKTSTIGQGLGSGGTSNMSTFLATGGNVTYTLGGYSYHVFTSTGQFNVLVGDRTVEFLVVGGGGGAGAGISQDYGRGGGGGGAGGLRCSFSGFTPGGPGADSENGLNLTSGTYPVTVGDGGTGFQPGPGPVSANGTDSSFGPPNTPERIIAGGGGRGAGSRNNPGTASNGGSGGGGSAAETATIPGGAALPGPGFNPIVAGYAGGTTNPESNVCGGGGGAGGAGQTGDYPTQSYTRYGRGGDGMVFPTDIIPASYGTPGPSPGRWFAQGGYGESSDDAGPYVLAGGGGGNPHHPDQANRLDGTNGVANTGSGGGGMGDSELGGTGGSGIIFLRYRV